VLIAGLLTELTRRSGRWMPAVAPLNTAMAVAWIVVLLGLSLPIFNVWAISATSQERLLATGKIDASKFDFGYLKFRLGPYGKAALDRLNAATDHPQAAEIRAGAARAENAQSYWEYSNPALTGETQDAPSPNSASETPTSGDAAAAEQPGPMDLQFNPDDSPSDDNSTSPEN
jgi:hypothetical protein